jgi:DNA-binding beta-propeller fold protein YncE
VLARLPIPQVAGIIDAPDQRKVFAADAQDNVVYVINADTMQIVGDPIPLQTNESPDAVSYDPVDHLVFISDPGTPIDPTKSMNTDPMNQNVVIIDAVKDAVVTYIHFGMQPLLDGEVAPATNNLPTWGYDVGHNEYDLGHDFVTIQVAANSDSSNPYILPPPHTAEFDAIDVQTLKVQRLPLPASCSTPHGMTIDREQHVAFIACTDFDAASNLYENLLRVDLQTMTVIPADPRMMRLAPSSDIVRLDHVLHLLFVASSDGITIFDEKAGEFHRLNQVIIGRETHTIAINDETHEVYFSINAGGLPVLRITRFNPNGA